MESTLDFRLVGVSMAMAIAACHIAVGVTRRVATTEGTVARIWLAVGALAVGAGIWTAQFVGVLAVSADAPQHYSVPISALSCLLGVGAAAAIIHMASRTGSRAVLLASSVLSGTGFVTMHYLATAARVSARADYGPGRALPLMALSVVVALALQWACFALARSKRRNWWMLHLGSSVLLGTAVWGLLLLGLRAVVFSPLLGLAPSGDGLTLPDGLMAASIGTATLLVMVGVQLAMLLDDRVRRQDRLGERLRELATLQSREMAEQAQDLQRSREELQRQRENLRCMTATVEQATDAISVISVDRRIDYVNPQFEREFGYTLAELQGRPIDEMGWGRSEPSVYEDMHRVGVAGQVWSGQVRSAARDGTPMDHDLVVSPIVDAGGKVVNYVQIRRNVTERLKLERQLQQAQKLESIGQLAAGIAHEINTPSQYIGDNTRFLKDSFVELVGVMGEIRDQVQRSDDPLAVAPLRERFKAADLDYLLEEVPRAIDQSLEGVARVTSIVRAMKEFSHPSQEMAPADLNHAIQSTVTVATSEWKYVATVDLDLDPELPHVPCLLGDFNQVVLNIVVNAAHAIGDVVAKAGGKGAIGIRTRVVGDWAEIRITDTGTGIPEHIRARIFDPFFTTKEVGKGTGQGLSIAHAVIVSKHSGELEVENAPGAGACFIIRLPLQRPQSAGLAKQEAS